MKALRLPIRASGVAYWFASTDHAICLRVSLTRSCKSGGPLQARAFLFRLPCSGFPRVDANGISQVFRRSIRCLCSVPRPRPGRGVLAIQGHLSAALVTHTTKAPATFISGLTRSFGTCCLRFTRGVAAHVQGSLPAAGLRLCREGVEPSGSLRKVSVRL